MIHDSLWLFHCYDTSVCIKAYDPLLDGFYPFGDILPLLVPSRSTSVSSGASKANGNSLFNCMYSPFQIFSASFLGTGGEFIPSITASLVCLFKLTLMMLDRGMEGEKMPAPSDRVTAILVKLPAALDAMVPTPLQNAGSINAPPTSQAYISLRQSTATTAGSD